MDYELNAFKTIDLREYAASLGYEADPNESTRTVVVMRRGADKIHVRLMPNGDFTWYSFRDDRGGSIIDFAQHREAIRNLGEVRKKLRAWDGEVPSAVSRPSAGTGVPLKDLAQVRYVFSKMQIARRHPYLENERGIPRGLLASVRFEGRVRSGWKGCAIFPHFDEGGICGFEIRGRGF